MRILLIFNYLILKKVRVSSPPSTAPQPLLQLRQQRVGALTDQLCDLQLGVKLTVPQGVLGR